MNAASVFESIMGERCLEIEKMNGGRTNQSFSVVTPSGHYILRLPGEGTNSYINRAWEVGNMRQAADLGLLPQVFHADPNTGIIITQFIEGNQPMAPADIGEEAHLRLICGVLARLHRSDVQFGNEFDVLETKNQYLKVLAGIGKPLPEQVVANAPRLQQAVDYLFKKYPKELSPGHGDPKLDNFLLAGQDMYLIDWEYSGMSDPYFDLVNMPMTNQLTPDQEQQFLRAYEECSGVELVMEKYILYKVATDYLWLYWHLIKLFQGQMVEYNQASWQKRLYRALENIQKWEAMV